MKARKSKQCCCKATGNCLTCTDGGCSWTVRTGSFSYGGGEWTGTAGAIQYTDLGYPWAAPSYGDLAFVKGSCVARLNDGDGVRIIGDIEISGPSFIYSWVGLTKDFGKVIISTGRTGWINDDRPGIGDPALYNFGRHYESYHCYHDSIIGCVEGEIEVLFEACFNRKGTPFGRAPLFAATIHNIPTDDAPVATIPTAVGMMITEGNPGISSFQALVAKVASGCQYCGTEDLPDSCDKCLPGATPGYIDVTLPTFNTEGPTCNPSCSSLSGVTLRTFQYTDERGIDFPCTFRVTTNGMCFSRIPVFGGFSDSIALTLSLDHIAEDLGSYLEMTLKAVGGTQSITWQTDTTVPNGPSRIGPIPQGEHGLYWPDYDTYDCSCYINNRQWEVRDNSWLYLTTVCRAMGPAVTTCQVREFA